MPQNSKDLNQCKMSWWWGGVQAKERVSIHTVLVIVRCQSMFREERSEARESRIRPAFNNEKSDSRNSRTWGSFFSECPLAPSAIIASDIIGSHSGFCTKMSLPRRSLANQVDGAMIGRKRICIVRKLACWVAIGHWMLLAEAVHIRVNLWLCMLETLSWNSWRLSCSDFCGYWNATSHGRDELVRRSPR